MHANPADHVLNIVSTDFIRDPATRVQHVSDLAVRWFSYAAQHPEHHGVVRRGDWNSKDKALAVASHGMVLATQMRKVRMGFKLGVHQTTVLMKRNMINYSRNLLAYGVRLGMYCKSIYIYEMRSSDLNFIISGYGYPSCDCMGQPCADID